MMLSGYVSKLALAAAALLIAALVLQPHDASAVFGKKLVDQTGCPCFTCPSCKHTCDFESELVDVEKTCFEVEEKVICIPRVVFPWQKKSQTSSCGCSDQPCTCTHNGAKTRKICVLKTKKYECPECKYSWSPKEKECITGCDSGCADAPCDAVQWSTPSVASGVESEVDSESHPWTAAEPVVSELPQARAIDFQVPTPVDLPQ